MKKLKCKGGRSFGLSVAILGSVLLPVGESQASVIVNPGWDLFQSGTPGTVFAGQEFEGVPLGTFDFGGVIGVQNVGNADTIVHRIDPAVGPGLATTIPIELVALQLKSVNPFDPDGPGPAQFGYYYASLNPNNPSLGTMDITFDANHGLPDPTLHTGTFDSTLNVHFDILFGSLNGPIVMVDQLLPLTSTGTPWDHTAPAGALLIDGVNHRLNGNDISADFWPAGGGGGGIDHDGPHPVLTALAIPEVSSSFVLAGLLVWQMLMRRRS